MTDEEKEAAYDADIAPLLLRAANRATECGIPLLCLAEWNSGHIGRTESGYKLEEASLPFIFVKAAEKSNGNLDALVIAIVRFCKERGIATDASIVAGMIERPAKSTRNP